MAGRSERSRELESRIGFYRHGRRGKVELGASLLGRTGAGGGAKLGEDADSARGSAMATVWRAGARVTAVQCQESWLGASLGAASVVWAWARHLSAQVAGAGARRCRWMRCMENGGGRCWQWQFRK